MVALVELTEVCNVYTCIYPTSPEVSIQPLDFTLPDAPSHSMLPSKSYVVGSIRHRR